MNATIQDLKMQIRQLSNTVSHLQSARSNNLPSQTIPNLRGNSSTVTLRSGKELSQPAAQLPRSTEANLELDANSQVQQQEKTISLLFPSQTVSARKSESDEGLLKMFHKVEINIPFLDAIKQIPKYAKFLKELCVHKRKKMKRNVDVGGIISLQELNHCRRNAEILESFQSHAPLANLENKSVVQPIGVLEDVLVQVNKLIFPTDFYVLDMEDKTSRRNQP
ncbi:hypothetical protein CR513_32283, partial [Mucuna pruriens]